MKIALALSGGGYRATVFHLGVMARLSEQDLFDQVSVISTVSGGSLCIGLVHGLNNLRWPNSQEYQNVILPDVQRILTTTDLQKDLITRVLGSFWMLFGSRAGALSALIQQKWEITARVSDLPEKPRWLINATCYETGKNWRFEKKRMGDYLFGYSNDTDQVALSDAMAASAGFPGGIGALELDASQKQWYNYSTGSAPVLAEDRDPSRTQSIIPAFPQVHLWDGGAYDNHGLEGVHDFVKGWQLGIDFLMVSDAAGRAKPEAYHIGPKAIGRLMTGIMMDQVRSLRARAIIERFVNHKDQGAFFQTGNTCEKIIRSARKGSGLSKEEIDAEIARLAPGCLPEAEATKAAEMATVIRKLRPEEYQRLFRHGYEVADLTLYAYYPDVFPYHGYANSPWGNNRL